MHSSFLELDSFDFYSSRVDYNRSEVWSEACEHPLDDQWLLSQLDRMNRSIVEKGPPRSIRNVKKPLGDVASSSMRLIGGRVHQPLADLLSSCIANWIFLPVTRPKWGGEYEPCGWTVSAQNLGPEWIRHFLGSFYDKNYFEASLRGRTYYPYENRDHLVHTLTTCFLGEACLGMPISTEMKALAKSNLHLRRIPKEMSLLDLIIRAYDTNSSPQLPSGSNYEQWVPTAWPALSLWHDSGYDVATWYLLCAREFRHTVHLRDFQTVLKNKLAQSLQALLRDLGDLLDPSLVKAVEKCINELGSISPQRRLYDIIWQLEECNNKDPHTRKWGRFHALLSASEFLYSFSWNHQQRQDIRHLAIAIAEHHEQTTFQRTPGDASPLWNAFVRNPLGSLLSFVDYLATFQRTKVSASSGFVAVDMSGQTGQISFPFDTGHVPLWIFSKGPEVPVFHRGRPGLKEEVDRRSLFGIITEPMKAQTSGDENSSSDQDRDPHRVNCCPFGDCAHKLPRVVVP